MNRLRKGDEVAIIAGRDRGRRGVILRVALDARGRPEKVVVEGANIVKRHTRPNPQKNNPGGIVNREALIHASNVALFNPASGKGGRTRIAAESGKDAKKRVFVADGKAAS